MSHEGNDEIVDAITDREVKKPEKKEKLDSLDFFGDGYNKACDDWGKYLEAMPIKQHQLIHNLPSEGELLKMTDHYLGHTGNSSLLAKAISKRIGGK